MKKALMLSILCFVLGILGAVNIRQDLSGHENLSVGDRFYFNIRADVALKSVAIPDTITNFHVLKVEKKSDKGKSWLQLTLVPLLPGSHRFPALEVYLEKPDGQIYRTERFRVNIIPVRAETDSLLVDIKPLEKYPLQFPVWVYLLLLGLMVVFVLLFLLLQRKPKQAVKTAEIVPVTEVKAPNPAWKTSLEELERLKQQGYIAQGMYIPHHYELSQILRRFLEIQYRFAAVEMTTSEIMWVAERVRVEQSRELIQFLRYCDMVKFARYLPNWEEVENAEQWLKNWLQSFEVLEAQRSGVNAQI